MTETYDKNTLYLKTGVASDSQLRESLEAAIKEISLKLKKRIACKYWINIVVNDANECLGYGYVWVENPIVYNILTGFNEDGSPRITQKVDENWKKPEKSFKEAEEELKNNESISKWSDIQEAYDELVVKYEAPKINVQMKPLVTLPPYKYNDKQKKHIQSLGYTDEMGYFQVFRAHIRKSNNPDVLNYKLISRNLPKFVNVTDLHNIFDKYNTQKFQNYPKISIVAGERCNKAYIDFFPGGNDAEFALLMTRCIRNYKGKNEKLSFALFEVYRK